MTPSRAGDINGWRRRTKKGRPVKGESQQVCSTRSLCLADALRPTVAFAHPSTALQQQTPLSPTTTLPTPRTPPLARSCAFWPSSLATRCVCPCTPRQNLCLGQRHSPPLPSFPVSSTRPVAYPLRIHARAGLPLQSSIHAVAIADRRSCVSRP